jgi:hypothetical protein
MNRSIDKSVVRRICKRLLNEKYCGKGVKFLSMEVYFIEKRGEKC